MPERVVLVTGCSSGIGLGVAQRMSERGWRVIAGLRDATRTPPGLQPSSCVALDLAERAQIVAMARGIERLDCLINNAGYALAGPFAAYAPEQMARQLEVNLLGPALLTQQLLPALKRAHGRIINVSSVLGETGMPMMSMYCAAKHALEGWSESLRHELADQGVQVALVEPGGFRTRFAANMDWGALPSTPESDEAKQLARYRAMQARLLARPGNNPATVVDAIVRLAEASTMPMRTRIGADARALALAQRLLPERWAIRLIALAYRRRLSIAETP